jgi:hypothetical protein
MSCVPQATTESGQWVGNGLRFATREEADAYVAGLSSGRNTRVVGGSLESNERSPGLLPRTGAPLQERGGPRGHAASRSEAPGRSGVLNG